MLQSATPALGLEEARRANQNSAARCPLAHSKMTRHVAFAVTLFVLQKIYLIVCTAAVDKYILIVSDVASSTTKPMASLSNVLFVVQIGDQWVSTFSVKIARGIERKRKNL